MDPKIHDFILTFSTVLWEAMPFIVLGRSSPAFWKSTCRNRRSRGSCPKPVLPAVMIGAVLGLVFPMCECGIVVVMRRLLRKGLPLSCCVAYMLAGPIINVVVIFSTWVAFQTTASAPEMVGLRVGSVSSWRVVTASGRPVCSTAKYGNALLNADRDAAAGDSGRRSSRRRTVDRTDAGEPRTRPADRREAHHGPAREHLRDRTARLRRYHRVPDSRRGARGHREAEHHAGPDRAASRAISRSWRSRR